MIYIFASTKSKVETQCCIMYIAEFLYTEAYDAILQSSLEHENIQLSERNLSKKLLSHCI